MSTLQILDMEQRSKAWYEARCGVVTASVVGKLVTPASPDALAIDCPTCGTIAGTPCVAVGRKIRTEIKTPHVERLIAASDLPPIYAPADNEASRGLITHLASERIAGIVEDTWTSRDMERGILAEPFARDLYSKHYGKAVECGFMVRDFGDYVIGYSPDGLVGDDGLIEIKAPRPKAHVAAVVAGQIPPEYMAQCQTGLLVSGRAWCDFVPYVGGLPLWKTRVLPDGRWFDAITEAAELAERAICEQVAKYEQAVEGLPATERIDFFEEVS